MDMVAILYIYRKMVHLLLEAALIYIHILTHIKIKYHDFVGYTHLYAYMVPITQLLPFCAQCNNPATRNLLAEPGTFPELLHTSQEARARIRKALGNDERFCEIGM